MVLTCFFYGSVYAADGGENLFLKNGWKFHKGDFSGAERIDCDTSTWSSVKVPHTWNTDLINGDTYFLGICWYRNIIVVTEKMEGKRLFLRFRGVNTVAEVYINGKPVGNHKGGYSAFCFEITDYVHSGQNTLAVKVDNSFNNNITPVSNNLFTRFGGIYRPVELLARNKICITPLDYASSGVYLKQKKVSPENADLEIITKISNGSLAAAKCEIEVIINDADKKVVKKLSKKVNIPSAKTASAAVSCNISDPHLWNAKDDPYLYSVKVTLSVNGKKIDSVTQSMGLRYFNVDPVRGFFLNGNHISLYGVNRHQEWEKEGSALTDRHHERDISLILELGAKALRLAHYQQADKIYELCDKSGIIVWAEVPVTPPYQKGNKEYFANCKQQLIEIIRQNYNHPSIFFWGLYNEVKIPDKDLVVLHNLAKSEDPFRLTTAASNSKLQKRHTIPDLQAWNNYPGWYVGNNKAMSKLADRTHKKYPEICVGISEYGAGGCIDQHQQNPKHPNPAKGRFFPEEYQFQVHENAWRDVKNRDDIWCKFIWNMFDFSWPIVKRGNRINMNHKGLITYDRKTKKDVFFFYKANWSKEPVLYITSRRHTKRKNQLTDVKVCSSVGKVELFVNGKSQGIAIPNDVKVAIWKKIELKKGKNTIQVKAEKNGTAFSDQCVWEY